MKTFIIAIAFLMSSSAFAQTIGTAGCGLGNLAFGGEESQVLASTTNGTFGSQTFGITSGTSNCTGANGTASLEVFVEGNRVAIETDAARGQGETVNSIAQILQCPSAAKVGAVLKKSHSKIFDAESSNVKVVDTFKTELKKNQVLCLNIG